MSGERMTVIEAQDAIAASFGTPADEEGKGPAGYGSPQRKAGFGTARPGQTGGRLMVEFDQVTEQPRERLLKRGPEALTDSEILSILLRGRGSS